MSAAIHRDLSMPILASSGFHKLCYREWGDPSNANVLICVHGLSRNRLDFDTIAAALCDHYRVIAVDMPGRGASDWLSNPNDYGHPYFRSVLAALLARVGAESVDWIGTSMGGILGIGLASEPGSPIRRMVLNDIGPFISGESRANNAALATSATVYDTEKEAIEFVLEARKAFGPFTLEAAQKFARDTIVRGEDGRWRAHYDPRITHGRGAADTVMWDRWALIDIPVLTLWGKESTLLSAETVARMQNTGPKTELLAIDGVGHCPGLTSPGEIESIRAFLLR